MEQTEMDIFDVQELQQKIARLQNEHRLLQLTLEVCEKIRLLKSGKENLTQ